ncbi:MAG: helix-turn-helix transcriptional regulator, partial [Bacilli bacterium]|nr:helix-turn-helix transcriptional regulator [Bacilli bacterium]
MDNKRVGKFIRELRKEKGLNQYELADKLMVSRPSVSKWERGTMSVTPKNLILLCEFFGVTTDELMAGERSKKCLTDKVNEISLNILDNNMRLHRILKYMVAIIILLVVSFLAYYFYTFYNSVKIYSIYFNSDKYSVRYGQLTKTSDKIYFYLDIDYLIEEIDTIESIQLFYINGSKLITLGEMNELKPFSFIASKGYDEFIKFDDFDIALNNMYIYVNFDDGDFERIDLEFKREYANTKVLPRRDKDIVNHTTTKYRRAESTRVYERFLKVKDIIEKHGKDGSFDFRFEDKDYNLMVIGDELIISSVREKEIYKFYYS